MTIPISTDHARQLARLRQHEARPDFVLIGAAALGHHVPLRRKTNDVDLALVVAPADIEPMLASLDWTRDPVIQQRWFGPNNFRADVLPATPDLIRAAAVPFDDDARTMSLVGFDLALEHASEVELPGTAATVRVASLASIVVLKIVAWLDRPGERTRDLGDLATVFRDALGEDDERRWDRGHPVAELDFDDQSPFFVGREVGAITSPDHRARIDAFVDHLLREDGRDAALMARAAGLVGDDPDVVAQHMVRMFARGVTAR